MNKTLRIVFDMDDTMCYSVNKVVSMYNKEYNENISINRFKSWNLQSYVAKDIYKFYKTEHFFKDLKIFSGVKKTFRILHEQGHTIVIATSVKGEAAKRDKMYFLEVNGLLPYIDEINMVVTKETIHGDIIFDDGVHNLEVSPATHRVVYDRPYNKKDTEYDRVHDYKEVMEYVERVATM